MDAEYHELRVAAAEALRALLMKSEPGTGATLHAAYAELRHEIGRSEGAAPVAASPVAPHWGVAAQEWKETTTVYEREQTVLEHIADDRLTVRELDERMRAAGVDCWISTVQSIVNRLYSRGDLAREREQFTPRKYRWRYFRPALEGPDRGPQPADGRLMSRDSYLCRDCGIDTTPCTKRRGCRHKGRWEHYMVTDTVWSAAGMQDGFLCIGCLEQRLGRILTPEDFTSAPINDPDPWDTERLASRKRGEA